MNTLTESILWKEVSSVFPPIQGYDKIMVKAG